MSAPFKLAQITDTHLLPHRDDRLRGVATWHSLKAVLAEVQLRRPDAILLTGDLAEAGDAAAYDRLWELLAPLNLPCYALAGNHDRPSVLAARLGQSICLDPHITLGNDTNPWQLLLLDSTDPNARYGEGKLSATALAQLEAALTASDRPLAIALHHHPVPTGIDWLDTIGVVNSADFLPLLQGCDRLKFVLFGHIHLALDRLENGIHFYGTPSTCTQVLPEHPPEDAELPGFRWLELFPDGRHHTRVVRVRPPTSCG